MTRYVDRLFFVLGSALMAGLFLAAVAPVTAQAAEDDKKIAKVWKTKCASCHGAAGKADNDQAKEQGVADMSTADWQKAFTDEQLKTATLDGIKREKNGKKQEMKPYKEKLKPDEVDGLVKLMRSFAAK